MNAQNLQPRSGKKQDTQGKYITHCNRPSVVHTDLLGHLVRMHIVIQAKPEILHFYTESRMVVVRGWREKLFLV